MNYDLQMHSVQKDPFRFSRDFYKKIQNLIIHLAEFFFQLGLPTVQFRLKIIFELRFAASKESFKEIFHFSGDSLELR